MAILMCIIYNPVLTLPLVALLPKIAFLRLGLILRCLCDDDVTIRSRALELLTGMVTKKNLQELVDQLMQHVRLSEGAYRDELISKIVFMCSRDKYSYIADFKWYINILVSMSRLHGTEHGMIISGQIMDVATRVFPVREFCVGQMVEILLGEIGGEQSKRACRNDVLTLSILLPSTPKLRT